MIRATEPADSRAILSLATETGSFLPHEIRALEEVLTDYHAANIKLGHQAVTFAEAGTILGFAYWAPAAMTDRAWYVYWIAVAQAAQRRGIGGMLLERAEADVHVNRGRLLLIETSSLPRYRPARNFYARHRYEQAAVIPDFYADGDDLVIFRKRLDRD